MKWGRRVGGTRGGDWGEEEEEKRQLQDPQLWIQASEGPWSGQQWRRPMSAGPILVLQEESGVRDGVSFDRRVYLT